MSGKESDAVLAFLLGSMSSLDAPEHGNTVSRDEVEGVDDLPPREPVSDSDVEPHTAVSATADASSSSDLDTITSEVTSCESEDDGNSADTPHPEAIEQDICMKVLESKNSMEGKNAHIAEAEHEDDCADPNVDPDDGVHKEDKRPPKREKKSSKAVVKGRPESTGNQAVAKSKGRLTETKKKRNNNGAPTQQELLFVGGVATVLVAYLLACVYSFFHPVVFPSPNYEELFSAYDISNVSVHIVNPVGNSSITPQGVSFEWELANFPTEALHLYGAEVFRYELFLDDEVFTSEIEFLALESEDDNTEVLNRTVKFPIPLRKFTHDGIFKLHLEVTIPIPGLIEELTTNKKDVYVRKPPTPSIEDEVHLSSPLDGAIFERHQSIVLEYTAVNVQTLELLIDDDIYLKKTHVDDGNMLLRGLGVGPHTLEAKAVNDQNKVTASSLVHVEIMESALVVNKSSLESE
ncbi:hypothetical protein PInf_017164 [Phytophthora infestans]|nr:hypothetical protein PInf_017164 [Phytophthora infestans]